MNQPVQWQVHGSAADVYERDLVPAVFAPWAPRLVELAPPNKGDRVLDLACGTGIVTRLLASSVGPAGVVVGVDLNPTMLRVAAAALSRRSLDETAVEWREASADKLPFREASFDAVYCQLGLQFFADRTAALREMYRVLAAGGRVVIMVWRGIDESPGFAALAEALARHIGPAAASLMRAPFSLSDADELTSLVRNADFRDVAISHRTGLVRFPSVHEFVSSYAAGTPLSGPVSQASEEARAALVAEMRHALDPYASDTELAFPIAAHLLSARRPSSR